LLGDFKPYLWRTDDYGKSWTLLTTGANGIPADEPTRVVREDPDREGLLYAGTEFGAYVSFDNGRQWQSLQLDLPHTPITDMKVHRKDLVLSTQGRSFYILDNLTPLHQMADAVAKAEAHLFRPREAFRMRYSAGFGGVESSRSNPADPEYPPAGAMIDYWLASAPSGPITLEIIDGTSTVIRRFSSEGAGERRQAPDEPGMRRPEMVTVGTPRLPKAVGLNRFYWDLTLPGAWDANANRSGRNGPMIVPGNYTLRLTASGRTMTQPLTVNIDPRVAKDGVTLAELREQLQHLIRVRDMVSEVNQLVATVDQARSRLRSAGGAAGDTLQRLEVLRAKLVTPPVRYSKPELQAQISYLYGLGSRSDQQIGRDAIERAAVLRKELDARVAEARAILGASAVSLAAPSTRGHSTR
jgi:hypothetical protein